MFFTYVIQSQENFTLYKGHCADLPGRMKEHNSGAFKATRRGMPWKLMYFETFATEEEAIEREKFFKTHAGRKFLAEKIKA